MKLLTLAVLTVIAFVQTGPEMPKRFVIGSDNWLLLHVTHLKPGDDGETNCKTKTIAIIEGLEPRDEAHTIMHELMHALGCRDGYPHDEIWNNSNDPTDEEGDEGHAGIYQMAPRLVDFIVDNPELIKFIQEQGAH